MKPIRVDCHHGGDSLEPVGGHGTDRCEFFTGSGSHVAIDEQARIPERFGTALGLMWVAQNAGIAGTARPGARKAERR